MQAAVQKLSFHGSVFRVDDFKGEKLLSSPRFKGLSQASDVAAEARDVLSDINIALRIVNPRCNGFELRAVAEYRDGGLHRNYVCGDWNIRAERRIGSCSSRKQETLGRDNVA